jgi:hypothetical protein
MTEHFGPCGLGWGIGEPSFQLVPANNELLVYCTVTVWHGSKDNVVYGVGGDKVLSAMSSGLRTDDEAFKKAFTDAVTNALKMIGVGADVHMGMFDDNKYVNAMRDEFAANDAPADKPASSASLKRDGAWGKVADQVNNELLDVHSLPALESLTKSWRDDPQVKSWPAAWKYALKDIFETKRAELNAQGQHELAAG